MASDNKFAVLIDADNISDKYVKIILDEISNDGIATYKRIYGDWTKPALISWKNVLLDNSILPVQQYGYTTGKNATDSAMIIDAMDILYTGSVSGFCLVSSDSDFTRLAARLREGGMFVVGMGERKTPKSFISACNRFKYLDILATAEKAKTAKVKAESQRAEKPAREQRAAASTTPASIPVPVAAAVPQSTATSVPSLQKQKLRTSETVEPASGIRLAAETTQENQREREQLAATESESATALSTIKDAVQTIVLENSDEDDWMFIGTIGNLLVKRYPDFDVRNFGFNKLTPFIESLGLFDIKSVRTQDSNVKLIYVRIR